MYVFGFQAIRHESAIYSFEFIKVCLRRRRHDIGELKQPRRQRQQERRQTKGLMSRTIAVHVRYRSLYISLPSSTKQQREMTKFCVFWRPKASTANILDFLMESDRWHYIFTLSRFLDRFAP